MSSEERKYQLIDAFLKGKLEGKELEEFEKALQVDKALQEQVSLHLLANDLVIANRLQEVKGIFQEEYASDSKNSKWWKSGLLALTALGIAVALFVFLPKNKDKQMEIVNTPNISEKQISDISAKKQLEPSEIKTKTEIEKISRKEKVVLEDTSSKITVVTSEAKPDSLLPISSGEVLNQVTTIEPPVQKPATNIPEAAKADPCYTTDIKANIAVKAACKGDSDGEIIVSSIKGGTAPYKTIITKKNSNEPLNPTDIKAGMYNITISDSAGCERVIKEVSVPEKICLVDYHFNPYYGEEWSIPESNLNGKLFVYDNSGNVYFEKELTGSGRNSWNGQSLSGETKPGFYLFVIKYSDGTEKQGTITISQ